MHDHLHPSTLFTLHAAFATAVERTLDYVSTVATYVPAVTPGQREWTRIDRSPTTFRWNHFVCPPGGTEWISDFVVEVEQLYDEQIRVQYFRGTDTQLENYGLAYIHDVLSLWVPPTPPPETRANSSPNDPLIPLFVGVLTPRQLEVVVALRGGKTRREVAIATGLQAQVVSEYRRQALKRIRELGLPDPQI